MHARKDALDAVVAEAEDVAQSIALLLSDDSSMISGAVLPIDGGFLAV